MVPAVAGKESDFAARDFGDKDAVARRAVGGVHLDLADVFKEGIKA
jgi:hypothetical protein